MVNLAVLPSSNSANSPVPACECPLFLYHPWLIRLAGPGTLIWLLELPSRESASLFLVISMLIFVISLAVRDSTGAVNYSDQVSITAGNDASCVSGDVDASGAGGEVAVVSLYVCKSLFLMLISSLRLQALLQQSSLHKALQLQPLQA